MLVDAIDRKGGDGWVDVPDGYRGWADQLVGLGLAVSHGQTYRPTDTGIKQSRLIGGR